MQRIIETGNPILNIRPVPKIPSNSFSLSHDVKTSFEYGQLVPVCQVECMPGDSFKIQTECLLRLQALISPVMHRQNLRSEWFFVPYRLLWENWETFISRADVPAPVCPYIPAGSVTPAAGFLNDFLGLPVGQPNPQINAFFHAAYQKIYYDWYCDEDLSPFSTDIAPWPPQGFPLNDGSNADSGWLYQEPASLHVRNFDRDYFTSAKPFTQKGDAVVIPAFSGSGPLPVTRTGDELFTVYGGGTAAAGATAQTNPGGTTGTGSQTNLYADGETNAYLDVTPGALQVSAADILAMSGTIEQLRQAEALQKFLEADSRGGTRYIESLYQHFGVRSSDARLQRPEYIGSTIQPIVISEVLNTTGTTTAPQGALAGHGIAITPPNFPMHYYCEEHGVIMALCSVLPTTGYFQGIHKSFFRENRLDWPFPEFAMLGEQPIQNQEIYYTSGSSANAETFGYVPMYADWRIMPNRVSGTFKTSLSFWHLDRQFSSLPTLTADFIQADYELNNLNRVFATLDDTGHFLAHWFHKITVNRKLPRYVRPSI